MENQKSAPVYQVVEKFVSINGEGRRAGELAVFIRMKGCNLHCSYCDTYWANESDCESTEMTADEIISYIEESRIRNITLTGGEPLLREGMTQLIRAILQDPQRRVEIETNGSIDLTPYCNLERRPSFTMDYKMPESGMEHAMLPFVSISTRRCGSCKIAQISCFIPSRRSGSPPVSVIFLIPLSSI